MRSKCWTFWFLLMFFGVSTGLVAPSIELSALQDPIIVDIGGMSPDWVYLENGTFEDRSLLDQYNLPTYAPDPANQTPQGVYALHVSLNVEYGKGQYWVYLDGQPVYNPEGVYYSETGPFDVVIDTAALGTGWLLVHVHAVTAEPWLADSSHDWERWLYISESLSPRRSMVLAEEGPILANADGPYYPDVSEFHYNDYTFTQTDNTEYFIQGTNLNLGVEGNHSIWLSVNFTLPDYDNIVPSSVSIQGMYEDPGVTATLLAEFVDAWDWDEQEWVRVYSNSTKENDTEHTISENLSGDFVNDARNVSIRYGTNWTLPSGVWEFNGSYVDYCFLYYEDTDRGQGWLSGYSYRTRINLTGSAGADTDYVLKWRVEYGGGSDGGFLIYCTSHCQTNFGDVRWTDGDGTTELNYYLDEYTSGDDATFYVQVADDLDFDQIIYIYYGTSGSSSTTSNGPDTFYEWLDYTNTTGWTTSQMTVSNYDDYLRFYNPTTHFTASAERYDISYPSDQWRMLIRMKTISLGSVDRALISNNDGNTDNRFTEFIAPNYGDQTHYYYWNGSSTQGLSWVEGEEYVIQMTVDEDDSSAGVDYQVWYSGMVTHGLYSSNAFRTGSPTVADGIYITDVSAFSDIDARVKYFAIMPNIDVGPLVDSYGPEEGEAPPTTTTTTMIIISETWGFNTFFIIIGLVMVPFSGLYLVRGGRNELSSDKLFFVLIIFFMGCALFIGGIMP